jgi:hypothetical protein
MQFQKFYSTNSNASSEQTSTTPTHFKELAGKHPLPEVEKEKEIHEERKKSKDYILPHPIWYDFSIILFSNVAEAICYGLATFSTARFETKEVY